jgi:chromosome segregation ATPase
VFTFQSIMFVSLGFLCALLMGFVVAPAFWARAVRLTTERIRAALPLTEQEISAERDRLRAENAIRIHQLTAKIERARLFDARQKVEINRRDGTIGELRRRLQAIETEREGSENARRVLEATIKQRVPEVEARLMEARQLLAKRDAEMKALQGDTSKTFRALDDAMQLNAQQRAEIDRLKMSLAGHGARGLSSSGGSESEFALRAELESLRRRTRDQAAMIDKLQSVARSTDGGTQQAGPGQSSGNGRGGGPIPLIRQSSSEREPGRLNARLEEADAKQSDTQRKEIEALLAKLAHQAATIEKLSGELAANDKDGSAAKALETSTSSSEAGRASSDKLIAAKDQTIAMLRRELATANERLAQQASHYQNELRRLGTRSGAARAKPAEDDAAIAVPPKLTGKHEAQSQAEHGGAAGKPEGVGSLDARLAAVASEAVIETSAQRSEVAKPVEPSLDDKTGLDFDEHVEVETAVEQPASRERRGRLMDRIAGLAKR